MACDWVYGIDRGDRPAGLAVGSPRGAWRR